MRHQLIKVPLLPKGWKRDKVIGIISNSADLPTIPICFLDFGEINKNSLGEIGLVRSDN